MNKYGITAINAVELINKDSTITPIEAWNIATTKIFGKTTPAQQKSCPRITFLALCETGKIKGVQVGSYTNSNRNKIYALQAFELLKQNPSLSVDKKRLWHLIPDCSNKQHNSQMDVVTALWDSKQLVNS